LLTAPEIDYLFDTITGFKMVPNTLLSLHQWQKKVLDEKGNPLQVMRTLVKKQGLDKESILKAIEMKLWGPEMDIHQFKKTLRRLEPTLSDFMLSNLFERLGNKEGKVEVENMVLNLCGTTH